VNGGKTKDGASFEADWMMIATWHQVRWYSKPSSIFCYLAS